ncbi:MAG: hypothetical protein ACFFCZ_28550 [Promethearchaeota archaeon]
MYSITKRNRITVLGRENDRVTGIEQFLEWLKQFCDSSFFERLAAEFLSQVVEEHRSELLQAPDSLILLTFQALEQRKRKMPQKSLEKLDRLIRVSEKFF